MNAQYKFNTIPEASEEIKAGKYIIVVDDEDRENEGDLVCAAEFVTPETINFMATHARGLICLPLPAERRDELEAMERAIIQDTLFKYRGVVAKAARELSVSRTGLISRMATLDIETDKDGVERVS